MIVASFLVKHLLVDWREDDGWSRDTLVDADFASNSANWLWVAGSGANAAPYFRIFNSVLQREKFDVQGGYMRRWGPEIAACPMPCRINHGPPWRVLAVLQASGRTAPTLHTERRPSVCAQARAGSPCFDARSKGRLNF